MGFDLRSGLVRRLSLRGDTLTASELARIGPHLVQISILQNALRIATPHVRDPEISELMRRVLECSEQDCRRIVDLALACARSLQHLSAGYRQADELLLSLNRFDRKEARQCT